MALRQIVEVGGLGVSVTLDDALARRIRSSRLWTGAKDRPAAANNATTFERTAAAQSQSAERLREEAAKLQWYHSIPLAEGVVTSGEFDHAPYLAHYPIPARMKGMRVLDVATFDGYWAFEFERRGADEIVALDIAKIGDADIQPALRAKTDPEILNHATGAGFAFAKAALGSRVHRQLLSVYDLSPERTGMFDFVFCGDLLLHLANPMKALERIRSVVKGEAIFVDCFSPHLPGKTAEYRSGTNRCVWWSVSLGCLQQMITDANFGDVNLVDTFKLGHRGEKPWMWRAVFRARP